MRIDKWLWAARFFKTRSLAQGALAAGRVKLNDERTKASHELKVGEVVVVRIGDYQWTVTVRALSDRRGSAESARRLYEEAPQSKAERERLVAMRRYSPEPAAEMKGRPTKRDRRRLDDFLG